MNREQRIMQVIRCNDNLIWRKEFDNHPVYVRCKSKNKNIFIAYNFENDVYELHNLRFKNNWIDPKKTFQLTVRLNEQTIYAIEFCNKENVLENEDYLNKSDYLESIDNKNKIYEESKFDTWKNSSFNEFIEQKI